MFYNFSSLLIKFCFLFQVNSLYGKVGKWSILWGGGPSKNRLLIFLEGGELMNYIPKIPYTHTEMIFISTKTYSVIVF